MAAANKDAGGGPFCNPSCSIAIEAQDDFGAFRKGEAFDVVAEYGPYGRVKYCSGDCEGIFNSFCNHHWPPLLPGGESHSCAP